MSEVSGVPNDIGSGSRNTATLGAADWLGLAAAPTFAIMALLTGIPGGEKMVICGTAQSPSAIGGMVTMYLLMSGFHLAPWLRFIANRRSSSPQTRRRRASKNAPNSKAVTLFPNPKRHSFSKAMEWDK